MANQRLTKDTRLLCAVEATRGLDAGIAIVYVVPIAGESSIRPTREKIEVALGIGDGLPPALVQGQKQFGGGVPINQEFKFMGIPLRGMWTGYSHVGSGSYNWHEFYEDVYTYGARPLSMQFQTDVLETTAKFRRGRSVFLTGMDTRADIAGGAQYAINGIGSGDVALTDILSDLSLTATSYGLGGTVYFNSQIKYTVGGVTTTVDGVIAMTCSLVRAVTPEGGVGSEFATDMPMGVLMMSGELGLPSRVGGSGPTADLSFLENAEDDAVIGIDYVIADGPLTTCTRYLRTQIVAAQLTPMAPVAAPGVRAASLGLRLNQRWTAAQQLVAANMAVAGEVHSTLRGTYTIGASTNKIGVKINGGSTQEITLTQGSRTAAQVSGEIDAALTGGSSDVFLGYVRILTDTAGTAGSVQIDTGQANSAHAVLGFDGVARAGRAGCVARQILYNDIDLDYGTNDLT